MNNNNKLVCGMDKENFTFLFGVLDFSLLNFFSFIFHTYDSFRYDHTTFGSTIQNTCHLVETLFKRWRYFQRLSQSSGSS